MELSHKYIIGTHIMFYEMDMVTEHVQSIINAVETVDNRENITVDLFYNISEYFEKINTEEASKDKLIDKFMSLVTSLENTGCNVTYKIYEDNDKPITMVDYRRDLNYYGCVDNDYVIWGESDALLPKEAFSTLEVVKGYGIENNIHRYVVTFGLLKNGVNVPRCILGHAVDDTSMMSSCSQIMGDTYVQFIVKNILKVHNRNHPNKRRYCLQMEGDRICTQEKGPNQRGSWYENLKQLANVNLSVFGKSQNRFNTYDDFTKIMEKK